MSKDNSDALTVAYMKGNHDARDKYRQQIADYEEALRWYADVMQYYRGIKYRTESECDRGQRARDILAKYHEAIPATVEE